MSAQYALPDEQILYPACAERPAAKLAVQGVCLTVGNRVVLDDVSFDVGAGEIVGLLGPSGAGKSALLRCLCGLKKPNLGTVWLHAEVLRPRDRKLRLQMGITFQEPSLDKRLTALENLLLAGALYGLSRSEAKQRARDLLVFMEIGDSGDELVGAIAPSTRRRLELARALIHRPSVLLLDEPTVGLDAPAAERIWHRLLALRRLQGLSMIVSTHRADTAAQCDRLVVLDRGHVVVTETPANLLSRVRGDVIALQADEPEALVQQLRDELDIVARCVGQHVLFSREAEHLALLSRLLDHFPPGRFKAISLRRPTLADAFFALTGRNLDQEAQAGDEA